MIDKNEDRRIDDEIHAPKAGSDPFAAAMRATRMPMLITDPRQVDNPIVFANNAFLKLTGYAREEVLGQNCRFLQGPGTNIHDIEQIRQAIDRLEQIEIEILNYKRDGQVFWNRVLISPVFDNGELTYFFASQLDVTKDRTGDPALDRNSDTEMQRRIVDLTAAEDRLQFTLKAGGLGTWTLDIPSQRLVVSALCKANFGRRPSDNFTYEDLQSSIHPDDLERWKQTLMAALQGDGEFNIEYRINLPQGGLRWIEIRATTRFDAQHRPLTMSGISVDITDRKEAEAYKALINQEMSHRIKNTLATVQSIVNQSLRVELPSSELRDIIARRLEALGGAHDVLTGKDWDVAGMRQTVERAVQPFNADHQIRVSGPDVDISHGVSTALTMALHELATNAVKYGALSSSVGRVEVTWTIDGHFTLQWVESGGPSVEAPTRTGFGSRMIERALAASLKGSASVDYRPEGIRFTLQTTPDALQGAS